eukprot:6461735-Amphidinium_carterae.1
MLATQQSRPKLVRSTTSRLASSQDNLCKGQVLKMQISTKQLAWEVQLKVPSHPVKKATYVQDMRVYEVRALTTHPHQYNQLRTLVL